ncbi:hypothetical protein Tsubulata_041093 [Turnera subulata]|uniref:ADP-ribosyl cyclase/cyclic ADP-ribose hydrolase n=1 Tax=Turnera subulata TaxID=218843 RepID=A0A9Q0FMH0_9ROSI|nr:hypothetical protein Tsubulata_041093 [Turnera subulata]
MASSSTQQFDVFISFRGEDTRDNFTSHLYAALCRKKILTFIDHKLTRGEGISPSLINAIEESKLSVVVFSQSYASSRWCLDELAKILECKGKNGQMVIPVFYRIDPSDVRNQTGSFADAFFEHEHLLEDQKEKVQRWRESLKEAANLSGWNSQVIRPESELIEKIVGDILKKLNRMSSLSPIQFSGLVGIESRVKHIEYFLCLESPDVRVIGIWGMGGIGKTTIAEVVSSCFHSQFEGFYFLAKVRDQLKRHGVLDVRNRLLSNLLSEEYHNTGTLTPQLTYMHEVLRRKKVLIVLDDADSSRQIQELLAGCAGLFGPGSRILVTSRDRQVLKNVAHALYSVKELNHQESFQLFCRNAFKMNYPKSDFIHLSNRVADYAKGNPLALKVLGSSLFGRSKEDWVSASEKLGKVANPEVQNVLRISYDGLDGEQQKILLDIAYFLRGVDGNRSTKILDVCYSSVRFNISTLIDKSLLTTFWNKLELHDLIEEMCCCIVHEEPVIQRRSRLRNPKDIHYVLTKKKGTEAIEGICLDMSKARRMHLESDSFNGLDNLRFLKFFAGDSVEACKDVIHIPPSGLQYLPDELIYLHWEGFPSKSLPQNFSAENLVELILPNSNVEWLWTGKQYLANLRRIDLSESKYLAKLPDLSEAKNIEVINLRGCKTLREVPSWIQNLCMLNYLSLADCKTISTLPSMTNLKSLSTLLLQGSRITEFPELPVSIVELYIHVTAVDKLPSSIDFLKKLVTLEMSYCKRISSIPSNICELPHLQILNLCYCENLLSLPSNLYELKSLETLNLGHCSKLESFPEILEPMRGLLKLYLSDCISLKMLPNSIYNLISLERLDLSGTGVKELPSSIGYLTHLSQLELGGCKMLWILPSSMCRLKNIWRIGACETACLPLLPLVGLRSLTSLELRSCYATQIPSSLSSLSWLTEVDLSNSNFEMLPMNIEELSQLKWLNISNCKRLGFLPKLPMSLETLKANDCESLETLSSNSENNLMELNFVNCFKLNQKARCMLMANTLLNFEYDFKYKSGCILPGSDIFPWFSCQSEGSSVKMQLPSNCGNFKGIFFCLVLPVEELPLQDDCIWFGWECRASPENGDRGDIILSGTGGDPIAFHSIRFNHVLLWYNRCRYEELGSFSKFLGKEVVFEFYLLKPSLLVKSCIVKRCGVRILFYGMGNDTYVNYNEMLPDSLGSMMSEKMNFKRGRNDDGYDDPRAEHPKRLRLM